MNDINPLIWVAILVIMILAITAYIRHFNKPKPVPEVAMPTPDQVRKEALQSSELQLVYDECELERLAGQVAFLKGRVARLKEELKENQE